MKVGEVAAREKLSIEAAARQERHRFFAETGKAHRCRQILLGHHAGDAAETTLLNLFRGSGRLTPLRSPSEIRVGRRTLTFLRPLLATPRSAIDAYLSEHGIRFREDASNQSADHLRNRIRHQLLPLLDEMFEREVSVNVNRAAQIAGEEHRYLDSVIEGLDLSPEGRPACLSTVRLRALPLAIQRRAIHRWLVRQRIPRVSFEKVEACLSLLDPSCGPAKVNLPGNHHARRKDKALFIEKGGG